MSNIINQQMIANSLIINRKTNFFIPFNEIILLEGDVNYTNFIFLRRKKYMIARSIKHFETELIAQGFVRLHRSYIVNKIYIQNTNIQDLTVRLTNGIELQVARRRLKVLLDL